VTSSGGGLFCWWYVLAFRPESVRLTRPQTHNIALAGPVADFVVSLGQDGRILCQGTLSEALKSNKALLKKAKAEEGEVAKADEIVDDVFPDIPEGKGGKLILKEEIAEGHVSWSASKPTQSLAPGW